MKRRLLRALAALLLLAAIGWIWERSRWSELPAADEFRFISRVHDPAFLAAIESGREILAVLREEAGLPALSVAVAAGDGVVWEEAVGFAELESRTAAKVDSQFRIGSISKSVTGLAMARLIEAGRLDLDTEIHEYVPYYPPTEYPITPRQLASHQAGIRHYRWRLALPPNDFLSRRQFDSVRDSLSLFQDDPLLFEPGSSYSYSTHGFTLLSAVLEGAAGRDFVLLLEDEVYRPLGLRHTATDALEARRPARVTFYETDDGRYRSAYPVNNSNKWAGGGLISTAGDLVRMAVGLLDDAYLGPETRETLFEPQKLATGEVNPENYALGWGAGYTQSFWGGRESFHFVHHGGSSAGGSAYLLLFTEEPLALALLTNSGTGSAPLREAVWKMAEPFMDQVKVWPPPALAEPEVAEPEAVSRPVS